MVRYSYEADEAAFSKERCDIKIGEHTLWGNLKEYDMHIEPLQGMGVNLHFTSTSTPWRPGTSYFAFGDHEENYFTWLCAMPKGNVEGTITVDGEERAVSGTAYHDHQWGNINHAFAWNHWIWIRQNFGDYNILTFDLVSNKKYGFVKYPLVFIEDKEGNLVFESTENVDFEVIDEYLQEETGKYYPKKIRYNFENNGKKVEYTLNADTEINIKNIYASVDDRTRGAFDIMGMQPTYTRWAGTGILHFEDGNKTINRKGELIYEMVYSGKSYKQEA